MLNFFEDLKNKIKQLFFSPEETILNHQELYSLCGK
jgi:hypothetical protein